MSPFPQRRMRRLRTNPTLRDMLAEVQVTCDDLIAPIFVRGGEGLTKPIASMPGQNQYSVDTAVEYAARLLSKGIRAVLLFGIVDEAAKDDLGSAAWADDAPVQTLTRALDERFGDELLIIADTCLCEYTSHGHCGPVRTLHGQTEIDNDAALDLIAQTAVNQVKHGADIVAPSSMMDGQVGAIREALDAAGYEKTPIMSYSVKFASSLYGPFRDAAESPPKFGDRRTYQMDYRTPSQSSAEAALDLDESADILMVKPAGAYLDILAQLRDTTDAPLAAYQVSGEYAQLKAAAQNGWIDERGAVFETLSAIKRAGAQLIITYYAEQVADWLG
ncbi:MAG: porphobilinogen synthase [Phycisphaerales bacterium]|jgi:porphobilinogen synthase|nr:porphobilinogen synthase [Phycisphaerales bacterium]MBT7170337.1 porphobilinogen synthase [Phycisphaerales bacterium]